MTWMHLCAADSVSQRLIAGFAGAQDSRAAASCHQANPADSKSVCWPIATASTGRQDMARASPSSPADPAQLAHCAYYRRVLLQSLHVTTVSASGNFKL